MTSVDTGTVMLLEVRRRLMEKGVLFTLFRFRPYSEVRDTGESVMLIYSRSNGQVPASKLSPLIRGLTNLWEEDIHLYAFAEFENQISVDEVLQLMDVTGTSNA